MMETQPTIADIEALQSDYAGKARKLFDEAGKAFAEGFADLDPRNPAQLRTAAAAFENLAAQFRIVADQVAKNEAHAAALRSMLEMRSPLATGIRGALKGRIDA